MISVFENAMKDVKGMTVQSDNSKGRSGPLGISGGIWRLLIIPVLLCMILPLGASAFMFRNDTAHTGVYTDGGTRPNNVLLWNHSFGPFEYINATEWTYVVDNSVYSSPAVVDGYVYVGSLGNEMKAFNAITGQERWSVTVGSDIHSSPAVVDNVVYFTSYDHNLYALNAITGNSVWGSPADVGATSHSSPAVVDNVVYVASDNGVVYAFNTGDGSLKWSNKTNTTPMAAGRLMHSSPAVAGNFVYIGSEDNDVYAFNKNDGTVAWNYTTLGPVLSSPAVAGSVLYIGSDDGYLYALDAATGSMNWAIDTFYAIQSSPAIADGIVYVGNNGGFVNAINTASPSVPSWTFTTTGAQVISSPAVANGVVYVGNHDGIVFAIHASNGTEFWRYTTQPVAVRNWIYSSPAVANGVVYVGGGEGNTNLYAIGNQSGVVQVPVAAFTSDVRNGTVPLKVQFTNQSTGTHPMTYAWDFTNDGIVDNTTPNPAYTYNSVGVYPVNLTVTNGGGSNSSVKAAWINVTAAPVTATASKIGTYNPALAIWYLDYNGNGIWEPGTDKVITWGGTGYQPVTGNWDGAVDSKEKIGTYNPTLAIWYLDYNGNGIWEPGTDKVITWGGTGYTPRVGKWS